ncbi:hypothetical protein KUDE01_012557 [Dissostichus eleginoides]|uniref:Uncharacterized protein n=1 Tax=Dissostichus eleginoides TaxID=100907 RepID=A0AAD9FNE4_DISEL|nr:hypothetical protein KUDE01_012557 [Dissostichus eleginoides]
MVEKDISPKSDELKPDVPDSKKEDAEKVSFIPAQAEKPVDKSSAQVSKESDKTQEITSVETQDKVPASETAVKTADLTGEAKSTLSEEKELSEKTQVSLTTPKSEAQESKVLLSEGLDEKDNQQQQKVAEKITSKEAAGTILTVEKDISPKSGDLKPEVPAEDELQKKSDSKKEDAEKDSFIPAQEKKPVDESSAQVSQESDKTQELSSVEAQDKVPASETDKKTADLTEDTKSTVSIEKELSEKVTLSLTIPKSEAKESKALLSESLDEKKNGQQQKVAEETKEEKEAAGAMVEKDISPKSDDLKPKVPDSKKEDAEKDSFIPAQEKKPVDESSAQVSKESDKTQEISSVEVQVKIPASETSEKPIDLTGETKSTLFAEKELSEKAQLSLSTPKIEAKESKTLLSESLDEKQNEQRQKVADETKEEKEAAGAMVEKDISPKSDDLKPKVPDSKKEDAEKDSFIPAQAEKPVDESSAQVSQESDKTQEISSVEEQVKVPASETAVKTADLPGEATSTLSVEKELSEKTQVSLTTPKSEAQESKVLLSEGLDEKDNQQQQKVAEKITSKEAAGTILTVEKDISPKSGDLKPEVPAEDELQNKSDSKKEDSEKDSFIPAQPKEPVDESSAQVSQESDKTQEISSVEAQDKVPASETDKKTADLPGEAKSTLSEEKQISEKAQVSLTTPKSEAKESKVLSSEGLDEKDNQQQQKVVEKPKEEKEATGTMVEKDISQKSDDVKPKVPDSKQDAEKDSFIPAQPKEPVDMTSAQVSKESDKTQELSSVKEQDKIPALETTEKHIDLPGEAKSTLSEEKQIPEKAQVSLTTPKIEAKESKVLSSENLDGKENDQQQKVAEETKEEKEAAGAMVEKVIPPKSDELKPDVPDSKKEDAEKDRFIPAQEKEPVDMTSAQVSQESDKTQELSSVEEKDKIPASETAEKTADLTAEATSTLSEEKELSQKAQVSWSTPKSEAQEISKSEAAKGEDKVAKVIEDDKHGSIKDENKESSPESDVKSFAQVEDQKLNSGGGTNEVQTVLPGEKTAVNTEIKEMHQGASEGSRDQTLPEDSENIKDPQGTTEKVESSKSEK